MPEAVAENLSTVELVARDNAAADAAAAAQQAAESTSDTAAEAIVADDTAAATVADDAVSQVTDATPAADPILDELRQYAGDAEWLKQFKTGKDALKALPELQSLVGKQAQYVATVRQMEADGFTAEDYLAWKRSKQNGHAAPASPATTPEWDKSWVRFGQDGKVYPTSHAPADWEARFNRRMAAVQERMLDLPDMPIVSPQAVEERLQRTQQDVRQQLAAQAAETSFNDLVSRNEKIYYTDGLGSPYTALGKRVNELMTAANNYGPIIPVSLPQDQRLRRAHELAMREMPKAQPRTVPATAKPIVQPKVNAGKAISGEEWMKQNPATKFASEGERMHALDQAERKGIVDFKK